MAVEILLLGLPAHRLTPLQRLLERAKYRVDTAPDVASAANLLSQRRSPHPLLVLTDSPANHDHVAALLACIRAGGRSAQIVYLIPADSIMHGAGWQFADASDHVHLPAQPGTILRVVARAASHCTADAVHTQGKAAVTHDYPHSCSR